MMEHCIGSIVTWLIRHDAVEDADRELYEYAVYSLLITLSPLFIIVVIGSFMGMVKESVLLILPFMTIRKFSGGFHAKHGWTCFIGSCAVLFLCVILASHITCNVVLTAVVLGAVTSLCILSPIDSDNRRLSEEEKRRYKKVTCITAGIFAILYVLLYLAKLDTYAVCVAVGLVLPASLQLPCIMRKDRVSE